MSLPSPRDLRAWTPVHVSTSEPVCVTWARLAPGRFTDPFFAGTVMRAMQTPFNLAFPLHTPIACIEEFAECGESVPLRGFVYHMSRSGSTLIGRTLAALPRTLVLSEPAPLSQILRWGTQIASTDADRAVRLVRGIERALFRPRTPHERDGFVKLAMTDVLYAPLLRRAFPDVPSIFAFRHPFEVLASQERQCGGELMPGALPLDVLAIDSTTLPSLSLEAWIAHAVAAVCRAALRIEGCIFVDYAKLPSAAVTAVPHIFGLTCEPQERDLMLAVAMADAKAPERRFSPDSEEKRRTLSPAMREAAQMLLSLYDEMRSRSEGLSFGSGRSLGLP